MGILSAPVRMTKSEARVLFFFFRFGLMGILSVIRMTEPDLNTLALGTDLTSLGLNLNSADSLYATFASPWADARAQRAPEGKPAGRSTEGAADFFFRRPRSASRSLRCRSATTCSLRR